MKNKLIVLALMFLPLLAQAADYEITVNRKKEGYNQSHEGNIQQTSQNWTGEIKIVNHAFKASPDIEVKYIIFVKRQDLGKKSDSADHVEKIKGSTKVTSIKPGAVAVATTQEVKLRGGKLDPNWVFANGGIEKSDDGVLGIWVRLYQGTTQIAEYVSPTTLKGKQKWD
jgi:hypothetical protein